MPYHLSNSSFNYRKTIPSNKNQQINCYNKNYLFERQINLQSREDKRRFEYERIEKENFKFSQRLINVKAFLNRNEHQTFFDKHCQIKQRLQRYPDLNRIKTKKEEFQLNIYHAIDKHDDSTFFIYNDKEISQKSNKLKGIYSKTNNQMGILKDLDKPQLIQKKLPRMLKYNSQTLNTLPPITSNQDTK